MASTRLSWQRGARPRGDEPGGRGSGHRPSRGPLINRLVAGLLRSPLSGLVDGTLLLLTVPGRRTGRGYTFPVQYATGPLYLWVWPGNPQAKTWWRNLRAPTVVTLRLRGKWVRGVARVVDGAVEPREAARGLAVYGARFPRTVGHLVDGDVTDRALRDAAAETVLVRIQVDDGLLRATRRAAMPAVSGVVAGLRRRPVPT